VQMGYEIAPGGGVRPLCMEGSCRDRLGRFGFLSPKATDTVAGGHSCILIEVPPACATKIKKTITATGSLGCGA
jgi:hypothetical protein